MSTENDSARPRTSRKITVAAAQLGPIHLSSRLSAIQDRLQVLLTHASKQGADLIVYPELALSTFFPRQPYVNDADLEPFFLSPSPSLIDSPALSPLFTRAASLGIDVSIGFAECAGSATDDFTSQIAVPHHQHFNTAVYFSAKTSRILSKYRKVHLPGTTAPKTSATCHQLEKRYFSPGNLGFNAFRVPSLIPGASKSEAASTNCQPGTGDPILGMLICNDRRWPEAWRCYGLQGVELILCGYNTTAWNPDLLGTPRNAMTRDAAKEEALFHHRLCAQAGSYQNACFSVHVAKCGMERGVPGDEDGGEFPLIGGTMIVGPDGDIRGELEGEEDGILVKEIDLADCRRGKERVFDFDKHRRIETYGRIFESTGVQEPELLKEDPLAHMAGASTFH